MDAAGALAQRLFRVEIRRLLSVIGFVVSLMVLSQCFSFLYGKALYVSPADKGTDIVMVVDSGSLNEPKTTDLRTVVNDSVTDDDVDYENEMDHGDNEGELGSEIEGIDVDEFESGISKKDVSSREESSSSVTRGTGADDSNEKSSDPSETIMGNSSVAGLQKRVKQKPTKDTKGSDILAMISKNEERLRRSKPTTLSQMNTLLLKSSMASVSTKLRRGSSSRDRDLLSAKLEIEKAPIVRSSRELSNLVFRNVSRFKRSYELMERVLKIYVYKEGEKPIFHQPNTRGIYASEGWFMKLMEANKRFVVRDPKKAHLFYLPFSSLVLRLTLNRKDQFDKRDLEKYLKRYVDSIARKYLFWNRTNGADHFLVACHDWASYLTRRTMQNCVRSLCNANVAKDFKIGKDTSFPVTYVRSAAQPRAHIGGKPASERSFLAFFAGGLHGYLRPILLHHWENKEPDMKIFGPMPRDDKGKKAYREYMKSSKYCICARGYEVHTPRVVESIFYECVPVIISDNYVPPFFEVLNWETFSVFVLEKDVHNLRDILLSIPEKRYEKLQLGVKMVQKHFFWHKEPVKYDLFHMTLHSVWNNRLAQVQTE